MKRVLSSHAALVLWAAAANAMTGAEIVETSGVRGGRLLLGGMSNEIDAADPYRHYEGRGGGIVMTVSPVDGGVIARHDVDSPPVWDGMAAARGWVYVATMDGRVLCLGGR